MTVKPDRFDDFVADVRQSKGLIEKHGGKNVRLVAALVGGEQTGALALICETEDFAALGSFFDSYLLDPAALEMTSSVNTAAGSVTGYQSTLWVDVAL